LAAAPSRAIHAWIDWAEDHYYICDSHSRTGTTVNGQIALGSEAEGWRQDQNRSRGDHFRLSDLLPAKAVTFDISTRGTNPDFKTAGILMQCECGARCGCRRAWPGHLENAAPARATSRCRACRLTGVRRPLTPNDSIVDMPALSGWDRRKSRMIRWRQARSRGPSDRIEPNCKICQSPSRYSRPARSAPPAPSRITRNAGSRTGMRGVWMQLRGGAGRGGAGGID